MEQRRSKEPAPETGRRSDPDAVPGHRGGEAPPDTEQRPIGALAIVGFLTLTILVFWYGMFALNLVRN